jgi:hypothetical protein
MFNKLLKNSGYSISYEYILSKWFTKPMYRNIKEYYHSFSDVKLWIEEENLEIINIEKYF